MVLGYTRGDMPDYQVAAWLMAVYLKGMTPQETAEPDAGDEQPAATRWNWATPEHRRQALHGRREQQDQPDT